MYHSWVTYSVAVYVGLLLAGALVDNRSSDSLTPLDRVDGALVEYQPPILPASGELDSTAARS